MPPSQLAAAIIATARLQLNIYPVWPAELLIATGYPINQLTPVMSCILQLYKEGLPARGEEGGEGVPGGGHSQDTAMMDAVIQAGPQHSPSTVAFPARLPAALGPLPASFTLSSSTATCSGPHIAPFTPFLHSPAQLQLCSPPVPSHILFLVTAFLSVSFLAYDSTSRRWSSSRRATRNTPRAAATC
jgi:hypothetical protein